MNWRTSGDTTFAAWDAMLPAHSQIKKNGESRQCYDAARPLSKLCLGMLKGESSFATDFDAVPANMNNPLNLKHESGQSFIQFATIADCIRTWRERITSGTYKGGVYAGTVTVEDLVSVYAPGYDNNNVPAYTATIEGVVNSLPDLVTLPAEEPSMSLTFGKVPHPPYQNRPIWKPEGAGQNNLGKRSVKGVTWHRVWGSLWGTDTHFRQPNVGALTDYGVGVKAQDGVANAGLILRWNDPLGFQSGWASGTYSAAHAYGDGAAFVNKYGVNAINRDRASIEISGYELTPLDDAARDAIASITAYWADQAGIPWDVFPIVPQDGFSFVTWHDEFGPDLGKKKCPFEVVKEETPALIERTRAILKRYQTGTYEQPQTPDGTVYAAPITYDWLTDEEAAKGLDRVIGRTRVFYVPQVYEAINETPRKQATGKNEKIIGPPIPKGTKFRADYCYRSAGVSYVLTPYGTRVRAADLLPKIQISTRGTVSVRRTPDQAKGEVIRKADS